MLFLHHSFSPFPFELYNHIVITIRKAQSTNTNEKNDGEKKQREIYGSH